VFITFEGLDGSGKSTQAKMLAKWLNEKERRIVLTREPGGWEGGAVLRDMAISGQLKHPWSEAYLFLLDRAEHVAKVIQPSIDKGLDVLCERYHDSTIAYQVWGRGLPGDIFAELAELAAFPRPDVTVLFDLPPDVAVKRAAGRGARDVFESEGVSFMTKIRDGYLSIAENDPGRWVIIDCSSRDANSVFRSLLDELGKRGLF